jgi:hypothetical protein
MSDTLGITTLERPPKTFIRGQTLEFIMELPCDVPAYYFNKFDGIQTNTTVAAELRQVENAGAQGFIASLTVSWEDIASTKLRFKAENTDNWPLGPAEFDVVFVMTKDQVFYRKFRSQAVRFTIVDGVTA